MNEQDHKIFAGLSNSGIGDSGRAGADASALSFEELEPVIAPAVNAYLYVD